jgi:hypothetical protein
MEEGIERVGCSVGSDASHGCASDAGRQLYPLVDDTAFQEYRVCPLLRVTFEGGLAARRFINAPTCARSGEKEIRTSVEPRHMI